MMERNCQVPSFWLLKMHLVDRMKKLSYSTLVTFVKG